MYRGFKYRLYPTAEQKRVIDHHFGCCRLVYNLALETKRTAWQSGVNLSGYDLCYQIVELKKDHPWLAECDSQALIAEMRKLDTAYKNFFRHGSGFPKFRKKQGHQSFTCPNNTRKVDWDRGTLTVPKIKNIPIRVSRKFTGTIKSVTISRTPTGKYFASILVDDGIEAPEKLPVDVSKTIGIDLGIKNFVTTSNHEKYFMPRYLKDSLTRLIVLQRRASRKQKGSVNRRKANHRVAVIHERITNQRTDFLQKLSTELVRDNQTTSICVESLAVKNLVRNHNLAQAISDVSWSKFLDMMHYKCEWSGKNFLEIGTFEPSSKTCSCCKFVNENLTLQMRSWVCENCHETHDRDHNAAKNIKDMGIKNVRSGGGTSEEPVESRTKVRARKQEKYKQDHNGPK